MCTEVDKKIIRDAISEKIENKLRRQYGIEVKKVLTVEDIKESKNFTATFNPAKKYKKIG